MDLTMGRPDYSERDQSGSPKWLEIMNVATVEEKRKIYVRSTKPCLVMPVILVGGIKYRSDDLRNSLERSSARETTML